MVLFALQRQPASGLTLDTRPSSYQSETPVVSGMVSLDTRASAYTGGGASATTRLDTRTAVRVLAPGEAATVVHSGGWVAGAPDGVAVVTAVRADGARPTSFHDGSTPAEGAATELARGAEDGSFEWAPGRTGFWRLSLATETNGVACADPLVAWFSFTGPTLSIVAAGAHLPGMKVSVLGSVPGWTIRYTTDGSPPTADSPVYSGPFAIQTTTTVRALSVSSSGAIGTEATGTFRILDPAGQGAGGPAVLSVSARQRYPWNGLVDVDVAVTGAVSRACRVELSAVDEAGGTNLPVRTAWLEGAPGAVGNPVDVPAPGAHRLVWNAEADLPQGFVSENVTISAKLLDPVWSFESIPAIDPNDEWAPETVYHDVQTVVSYGEIEDRTPTIRCLTDEWNLADRLGANVVFSGSSMGLRKADDMMRRRGVEHPVVLWAYSDATNVLRMVTLDYETGAVAYDLASVFLSSTDIRFFSMRGGGGRAYADLCRNGYDMVFKSANTDFSSVGIHCRYGDEMHGSAVCGYLPNGIPWSDASSTSTSSYNKATNAAVFLCGTTGTDLKQAIVGLSGGVPATSTHSCMGNPVGRYVVPLLDGSTFFTVACEDGLEFVPQHFRYAVGRFDGHGGWNFVSMSGSRGWCVDTARSKAVAMPDGERIFFGGTGRSSNGRNRMWASATDSSRWANYPAGHPFESWARRDVTCLLPNGKFCGVDEELGLVVVNPLTGETYVASDDPAFKKGKMGCQLLPNGKVLVIPYDCEGREYLAGTKLCGKLYEVDFGFTRSFSLSSLMSPYLRVAEGDPEPSGVKVGLDPNGGELPGVYAQYYKGESPVYGELPVPTRSDYTFLGWSTDGTAANVIAATDSVPQGGIKLKAVWKPIDLYLVVDLSGGTSATTYPVSSLSDVPEGGWTDEYKTTKLVLRRCKAGTFKMGNSYTTTLTKDFFIGVFEVTQKQYVLVTGSNPVLSGESFIYGDTKPVCKLDHTRIRGSDSSDISENSFMGRLRAKSGIAFDLPTEAQWEYACRAGTTSAYNNGGDLESDLAQVGRYYGNAVVGNSLMPAVPGQYAPNAWGLYDMHGNVQEVVLDRGGPLVDGAIDPLNLSTSSSFDHVKRGGDYHSYADKCTSSYRRYLPGSGSTGNSTVQDSGIRLCVTCE